jgi:hypothetical protein
MIATAGRACLPQVGPLKEIMVILRIEVSHLEIRRLESRSFIITNDQLEIYVFCAGLDRNDEEMTMRCTGKSRRCTGKATRLP